MSDRRSRVVVALTPEVIAELECLARRAGVQPGTWASDAIHAAVATWRCREAGHEETSRSWRRKTTPAGAEADSMNSRETRTGDHL
jgi:hypothetical protein